MIIQVLKFEKHLSKRYLKYLEENLSLTNLLYGRKIFVICSGDVNLAVVATFLIHEIADGICIHLVSVLSGTHTCVHLLFTDKARIFEMSSYITLFVLK